LESRVNYPIKIQNLGWKYGDRQILTNISLAIEKGYFYSIIGPNGSGKTTLLRNIAKSLVPKPQSVFVEDIDVTKLNSKNMAKRLSVVPQNTNIEFEFTVTDIVLMGRSPYIGRFQAETSSDLEIAQRAMRATNTWHLRDKRITEISGGERQRVIVARALAQDTGIMLLDEPVSQLDINHQIELMETIQRLTKTKEITAVSVMHDLNLAAQYSDYIILMNEGKVVCQGTPHEVITEENIKRVYKLDSYIMDNPVTGKPYIMHVSKDDRLAKHSVPILI
jgi:iron complex transport system ATP-binding protein